jgi:subtilisin family serine protease
MDVFRKITLCFTALILANCNSKQAAPSGNTFVKSETPACEQNRIAGEYLVVWKDGTVSVENSKNDKDFLNDFIEKRRDEIQIAEPHYRINVLDSIEFEERDWGGGINWGMGAIEADATWNKGAGSNVTVAIIDSGVDMTHPELQGIFAVNTEEELNGIDDDGNGLIDDINGYDFVNDSGELTDYTGHGTHIAGVIAARHDVGRVLGVAPNVKILPINFINASGGGDVSAAINAIRYAAARKVNVINASWGGNNCSVPLRNEILELAKGNILFVTAAGNSGSDLGIFPEYPAAFGLDNIISVGASTYDKKTAGFSNYGAVVDLVAPGANIVSTYPIKFEKDCVGVDPEENCVPDGLTSMNGTSMATPFVAASAAFLWSQRPGASFSQIKKALRDGIEPGPFRVSTRGQLNLKKSLSVLEAL